MRVIQKNKVGYQVFSYKNVTEFKRIGLLCKECRFLVETIATFESQVILIF
jgi:hypothetical protein